MIVNYFNVTFKKNLQRNCKLLMKKNKDDISKFHEHTYAKKGFLDLSLALLGMRMSLRRR